MEKGGEFFLTILVNSLFLHFIPRVHKQYTDSFVTLCISNHYPFISANDTPLFSYLSISSNLAIFLGAMPSEVMVNSTCMGRYLRPCMSKSKSVWVIGP